MDEKQAHVFQVVNALTDQIQALRALKMHMALIKDERGRELTVKCIRTIGMLRSYVTERGELVGPRPRRVLYG